MGITLDYSTKNPKVDRILQGTIGIFEQVFPDRIRGYYLRGSHGNGSNITNSDLDLYAIFKEDFRDATEIQNNELRNEQIENQILAMKYMKRIIYPNDEEIIDVLKALQRSHHETLKNLAFEAEQNINRDI
jgi:hypothetical protein